PTVTREPFRNPGRLTTLLEQGSIDPALALAAITTADYRVMLRGRPTALKALTALLDARGLRETRQGEVGGYVVERAVVEEEPAGRPVRTQQRQRSGWRCHFKEYDYSISLFGWLRRVCSRPLRPDWLRVSGI